MRKLAIASLAMGATDLAGVAGQQAFAADPEPSEAEIAAAMEKLHHDPLSLQLLDLIGTINFADAMGGIALQDDSYIHAFFSRFRDMVGGSVQPDHDADHDDDHHEHKFPLANMIVALGLNAARATFFGKEVRKHTLHELETTAIGVALLMGLTSVARGIMSNEDTAIQMTEADQVSITKDPHATIADSIFQLTVIAAATQLPLSSFGNAAIGNGEFRAVRAAYNVLYGRFLPTADEGLSRDELVEHLRGQLAESTNPVVNRNVGALLANDALHTYADFQAALKAASTAHTHDLMTILMSTSCDDAQAAAGDPGPLVGLYQMYGLDFLQAVPALIPYTIAIGFERALWASRRAGIQEPVFTRQRADYAQRFLIETWKNLIVYFATVAPQVSSRITGTHRASAQSNGVGVRFSILEQVLHDIQAVITAVMDPFKSDQMLDERKVEQAIVELKEANQAWHEAIGRKVARRLFASEGSQEEVTVTKEDVFKHQDRLLGEKFGGKAPYAYDKDAAIQNIKDLQIRLATLVDEDGVNRLASELKQVRDTVGPQLERELRAELKRQGNKPTIATAFKVLARNPRVRELLDINYWHDRIGPALTDTMFVVLLQGLHLPFLLNTSERVMYNARWFTSMPLRAREIVSILYNNFIGMFADNWADCVAHAKWLTNMYLADLGNRIAGLADAYPEVRVALQSGYFKDDSTQIIPHRFRVNGEQATALFSVLQKRYPQDQARLESELRGYLAQLEDFYFSSMMIAMTISVVGAGKSLPGDSTHFTFAAGEKDFTLAVTLLDFHRNPLYHVWSLLFSGTYAMFAGPAIAQTLSPAFGRLNIGSGAMKRIEGMMQAEFRSHYPGVAERFAELEGRLLQGGTP